MGDWYKLLPGLRWSGKLRVAAVELGRISVEFNATGTDSGRVTYIYDRAVLTPKQFTDWTGEPPPAGSLHEVKP